MSIHAVSWAVQDVTSGISPQAKMVLIGLANDANPHGLSCFPSLRRIARHANMSVGNVRYYLHQLEAQALIVVVRPERPAPGRGNRYALRMRRTIEATAEALQREIRELRERATLKVRRAAARVEGTVRAAASYRLREERREPREPVSTYPLPQRHNYIENSRLLKVDPVSSEWVAESLATARSQLARTPKYRGYSGT